MNDRERVEVADPKPASVESPPEVHAQDLALVREILAGSAVAWESFLRRYSGLILAVVRRYIHTSERDDVRTVYVDVLEALYNRKFASYQGRAALSTWLTLVARSEVLDYLRRLFGRRELPEGLRRLGQVEQEIYRLYYVQGRSLRDVLDQLRTGDSSWTLTLLVAKLRHLEDLIDDRTLRRIAYDLHAQSSGASSGRLLEYLDHVRLEYSYSQSAHSPDYHLMEREARRTVERVRSLIAEMGAEDREVLSLKFERGWSADHIADELGLKPRRRVYTILERILRRLRRALRDGDDMR